MGHLLFRLAKLTLRYSLDSGGSWAGSVAELALTGAGDESNWGGWADIPDTLRQSIGVQLAMFGSNGNGSTAESGDDRILVLRHPVFLPARRNNRIAV